MEDKTVGYYKDKILSIIGAKESGLFQNEYQQLAAGSGVATFDRLL
jgi:hypothetical protein